MQVPARRPITIPMPEISEANNSRPMSGGEASNCNPNPPSAKAAKMHFYHRRQFVRAVEQCLPRLIGAHREVEHAGRRNRLPVRLLVRAGRVFLEINVERTIGVELQRHRREDSVAVERVLCVKVAAIGRDRPHIHLRRRIGRSRRIVHQKLCKAIEERRAAHEIHLLGWSGCEVHIWIDGHVGRRCIVRAPGAEGRHLQLVLLRVDCVEIGGAGSRHLHQHPGVTRIALEDLVDVFRRRATPLGTGDEIGARLAAIGA